MAGVLDTKVILIPSYLDILLCVAEGYQIGSKEEWRDVLSTLNRNVDSNKLDSCIGSKSKYVSTYVYMVRLQVMLSSPCPSLPPLLFSTV